MSGDIAFGTLADVSLREAWTPEAHRFTSSFAANLDRFPQAIEIPLALSGTEMRVSTFSADSLARNPTDDSVVLRRHVRLAQPADADFTIAFEAAQDRSEQLAGGVQ